MHSRKGKKQEGRLRCVVRCDCTRMRSAFAGRWPPFSDLYPNSRWRQRLIPSAILSLRREPAAHRAHHAHGHVRAPALAADDVARHGADALDERFQPGFGTGFERDRTERLERSLGGTALQQEHDSGSGYESEHKVDQHRHRGRSEHADQQGDQQKRDKSRSE